MKMRDTLWLGVKGISERKLRTGLSILTVVIGVAAIVALVSLVTGIGTSISNELSTIGPTTLYMTPRTGIFTVADVAEIESLPNVSTVIPMIRFDANVSIIGQTTSTSATVIGVDSAEMANAIGGVNLYQGSLYNDSEVPYAVVGHAIAFPNTGQISPSVQIDSPIYLTERTGGSSRSITLIPEGLLNTYGSSLFISPDSSIFVSLPEAELLTGKQSYSVLLVQANNVSEVNALDSLLTQVYGSSASIISVQALASTVSSIIGSLSLLLGSIAGISLLVAGISILSIMMVSVTERTHEIGILKSIGFKKREILVLFLSEALIIGFAGGVIGVIVGGAGAYALPALLGGGASSTSSSSSSSSFGGGAGSSGFSGGGGGGFGGSGGGARSGGGSAAIATSSSSSSASSISLTPILSPEIIVAAILIAILVSILSSLYPAWKASTVDPITALRSE